MDVWFEAVPARIGHPDNGYENDPYAGFLPPVPIDIDGPPRAVVIVRDDDREKDGQRYLRPVATIPGDEWGRMTFAQVLAVARRALEAPR